MGFLKRRDPEGAHKGLFTRWFESIAQSRLRHEMDSHPALAEGLEHRDDEASEGDPYGKARHTTPH
jgi:hypothetical protein